MGYIGANPQSYLDFQGAGGKPASGLELVASSVNFTSQSEIDFTIPDRYDLYEFYFVSVHPTTTASILAFQVDAVGGSGYDETMTSTNYEMEFAENASGDNLQYRTNRDQDQDAGNQWLGEYIGNTGNDNDLSASGRLVLFAPRNSTYAKHWYCELSAAGNDVEQASYHSGYINTTTGIDKIRFLMVNNDGDAQGSLDGSIFMYGFRSN